MDRDASREGRAQREARSAHIDQHCVTCADHADIGAFAQAERAKPAGLVRGASDLDNSRPTSRTTRCQKARALRVRLSLLVEGGELGGHVVR